jgi:hypothetical protein
MKGNGGPRTVAVSVRPNTFAAVLISCDAWLILDRSCRCGKYQCVRRRFNRRILSLAPRCV